MATKSLSQLVGGGGELPQLAPDLSFPSDRRAYLATEKEVTATVTAGVLSTVLSLTGKFAYAVGEFTALVDEAITYKLTVDGVVIWNSAGLGGSTTQMLMNVTEIDGRGVTSLFLCNTSLLMEIQTTTDTSVTMAYIARPIV